MSDYNLFIQEAVEARHKQSGWRCEHIDQNGDRCPERSTQIAHLIGKGIQGRRAAGYLWYKITGDFLELKGSKMDEIINHPINTRAVCGMEHNGEFQVNPAQVIKIEEILEKIWHTFMYGSREAAESLGFMVKK